MDEFVKQNLIVNTLLKSVGENEYIKMALIPVILTILPGMISKFKDYAVIFLYKIIEWFGSAITKQNTQTHRHRLVIQYDNQIKWASYRRIEHAISEDGKLVQNNTIILAINYYLQKHFDFSEMTDAQYNKYADEHEKINLLMAEQNNFGLIQPICNQTIDIADDIALTFSYNKKNEAVADSALTKPDKKSSDKKQEPTEVYGYLYTLESNTSMQRIIDLLKKINDEYHSDIIAIETRHNDDSQYYHIYQNNTKRKIFEEGDVPYFTRHAINNNKTLEAIFIPKIDEITSLVDHFINKTGPFIKPYIPNKLSFLLYGPPGCGKTSFIKAIANRTGRHIISVPLQELNSDNDLIKFFFNMQFRYNRTYFGDTYDRVTFSKFIFVLEEVDIIGKVLKRRKKVIKDVTIDEATNEFKQEKSSDSDSDKVIMTSTDSDNESLHPGMMKKMAQMRKFVNYKRFDDKKLTLKGFLEVLDGIFDSPDRIVIMTSNHPEKLDPALYRSGRITRKIKLGKIDRPELIKMLEFYCQTTLTSEQKTRLTENQVVPSTVEEYVIVHQENVDKIIDEINKTFGED